MLTTKAMVVNRTGKKMTLRLLPRSIPRLCDLSDCTGMIRAHRSASSCNNQHDFRGICPTRGQTSQVFPRDSVGETSDLSTKGKRTNVWYPVKDVSLYFPRYATTVATVNPPPTAIERAAQQIDQLVGSANRRDLPQLITALDGASRRSRSRLQSVEVDLDTEPMVLSIFRTGGLSPSVLETTIRKLVFDVSVTEAETHFDDELSDIRSNTEGDDFDIKFKVKDSNECHLYGSVSDCDGSHRGTIASDVIKLEGELDDFDEFSWDQGSVAKLRTKAESWRAAVGLSPQEISWQDTSRVVLFAVFENAKASEHDESKWAFDFVYKVVRKCLDVLPAN